MPSYAHIISILWTWTITKRIYFIFVIEIFFYFLHHSYFNKWKVQQWMNEWKFVFIIDICSHSLALASKAENFQHIHPTSLRQTTILCNTFHLCFSNHHHHTKKWEKTVSFSRVFEWKMENVHFSRTTWKFSTKSKEKVQKWHL